MPTTWDELIAVADTFQANGVSPFYCTLKDAWTACPFVNLGGTLMPDGFFDTLREQAKTRPTPRCRSRRTSPTPPTRVRSCSSYCQDNFASRDYNAGNKAFADGESAMYLQGSYAIPAIRANNPDAAIGIFPYPVTDDADARVVVSGVDVGIMMAQEHPARGRGPEVRRLPDVARGRDRVLRGAEHLPPLEDAAPNNDPALAGLEPYFTDGKIIGFIDHQIPAAVPLVHLPAVAVHRRHRDLPGRPGFRMGQGRRPHHHARQGK